MVSTNIRNSMDKTWAPLKTGNTSTHTCFQFNTRFFGLFPHIIQDPEGKFPAILDSPISMYNKIFKNLISV